MARGAMWMILVKWVERGLGLMSTLLLVRLLTPADFGIVSMALSFIFMAELFSSFSFDVALIQNQSASITHYYSAWTANVMLGGLITLSMLALAAPISHFYHQPAIFPVVCALSLGPLIGGLENIGIVAFRKDLDFKKEFIFQVTRKIVAFSVTIPLAFYVHSYWALVAGTLASKITGMLMSYFLHPFRPRPSLVEVPSLLRFSRWMLLNNLVNFFRERSTDFVIGRFYGPAPLGIYNVNNEFASMPSNEMGAPINRALLPGFAKMAGDPHAIRSAFSNASGMVASLAVPAGAGIFAMAPYVVPVALGKQWLSGVPVMEVLSLNSSLQVFQGTMATALIAIGNPGAAMATNAIYVGVMLIGMFFLTGKFSSVGAAFSVMIACVCSTPIFLYQLRKYAGVPFSNFFRVAYRPALASGVMVAVIRWLLPAYHVDMAASRAGFILGAGVAGGVAVYLVSLLALWMIMGRPHGAERQILARVAPRIPAWVPLLGAKAP